MTGLAVLLLCATAATSTGSGETAPVVRVAAGSARLVDGKDVHALERRTGAFALQAESAWVEAGARSAVELVWRGRASVTITGPAAFELGREPELELARFQVAEVEVRRGALALVVAGLGTLEVGGTAVGGALVGSAVQLRALPGGVCELHNRGGTALTLRRTGGYAVPIPPGQRVRLRVEPSS